MVAKKSQPSLHFIASSHFIGELPLESVDLRIQLLLQFSNSEPNKLSTMIFTYISELNFTLKVKLESNKSIQLLYTLLLFTSSPNSRMQK